MNTKERDKRQNEKNSHWLPDHEIEALANCFLPSIREYFETPEGQEEYAVWQQEQKEGQLTEGA